MNDIAAPHLARRWAELADHPLVGETRSLGLLGAIELVRDKSKRRFFKRPGEVGTLCRDICPAQIDELADKARRCLDLTWAAVHKGDF